MFHHKNISLRSGNYACPRYESQYTSVSTVCALLWSKDKTTVDIESLTTTNYGKSREIGRLKNRSLDVIYFASVYLFACVHVTTIIV